jgi:hypothetical protein
MPYPLPRQFAVRFEDLRVEAKGLVRPECVLALSSGELLASHGQGGYSLVPADRALRVVHVTPGTATGPHMANGIALGPDGLVRFADLGQEYGGIFAIDGRGKVTPEITMVEAEELPPTNFVTIDGAGTTWFTVMTRLRPRFAAWRKDVADGFIGVRDHRGTRIVADGLGYANEIAFSPNGLWVYANETYRQRVSRWPRLPGNDLGARETVAPLCGADLPDGIAFDDFGGAWVTCIASNRLLVLRPEGGIQVVLEDTDPEHAERISLALSRGALTAEDMQGAGASRLGNISSLAFGGEDLRTVYLGCLLDDKIRSFTSPVAGALQPHWNRNLDWVELSDPSRCPVDLPVTWQGLL